MREDRSVIICICIGICLTILPIAVAQTAEHAYALEASSPELVLELKRRTAQELGLALDESKATMIVDTDQIIDKETLRELIGPENARKRRPRRAAVHTAIEESRWNMPIAYRFRNNTFSEQQKATFREAAQIWANKTCVSFQEKMEPGEEYFLSIENGVSCTSFVGRSSDKKESKSFFADLCFENKWLLVRELGNSLGLWHEQQRPDRDTYVRILAANAMSGDEGSLIKLPARFVNTSFVGYDYSSLMHHHAYALASGAQRTIETTDPLFQRTIGQRVELSFGDVKTVNDAYCSGVCAGVDLGQPCQNSGVQDVKNCESCTCPGGFTGKYCQNVAVGGACGAYLQSSFTEKSISSPGFSRGEPYEIATNCVWKLNTTFKDSKIRIRFKGIFSIFCRRESCFHWVEVRHGDLSRLGPRFCCAETPSETLVTSGPEALILFRSDFDNGNSSQRRGFQLFFSEVNASPCLPNPCLNSGKCISEGSKVRCECATGFGGINCSVVTSSSCTGNPCQNGATCTNSSSGNFTCICTSGWQGRLCDRTAETCGPCPIPGGLFVEPCDHPSKRENVTVVKVKRICKRKCIFRFFCKQSCYGEQTVVVEEQPEKLCCDTAKLVNIATAGQPDCWKCAVEGQGNWEECRANHRYSDFHNCGMCGVSERRNYTAGQNQLGHFRWSWENADTESRPCGGIIPCCRSRKRRHPWRSHECTYCCPTFVMASGRCIHENAAPAIDSAFG